MHRRLALLLALIGALSLSACDTAPVAPTTDASTSDAPSAGACSPGVLESDLESAFGLIGPGVDPETGALAEPGPDGYVVSSTYGQQLPTAAAGTRFQELMGDIIPELMGNPGLVALDLQTSASCGSGRTLAVWRDVGSMYAFVASTPHTTAMNEVYDVTRDGFVVTHWTATNADGAGWAAAIEQLRAAE